MEQRAIKDQELSQSWPRIISTFKKKNFKELEQGKQLSASEEGFHAKSSANNETLKPQLQAKVRISVADTVYISHCITRPRVLKTDAPTLSA